MSISGTGASMLGLDGLATLPPRPAGDPAEVGRLTGLVAQTVQFLQQSESSVKGKIAHDLSTWSGPAAGLAGGERARAGERVADAAQRLQQAQQAMKVYADELAAAQAAWDAAARQAGSATEAAHRLSNSADSVRSADLAPGTARSELADLQRAAAVVSGDHADAVAAAARAVADAQAASQKAAGLFIGVASAASWVKKAAEAQHQTEESHKHHSFWGGVWDGTKDAVGGGKDLLVASASMGPIGWVADAAGADFGDAERERVVDGYTQLFTHPLDSTWAAVHGDDFMHGRADYAAGALLPSVVSAFAMRKVALKGVEAHRAPLFDSVLERERMQVEQRRINGRTGKRDTLPPAIGTLPVQPGRRGPWTTANEMTLREQTKRNIAGIEARLRKQGLKPGDKNYQVRYNYAAGMAAERALRAMDPANYPGSRRTPVPLPGRKEPYPREHDVLRYDPRNRSSHGLECKTGLTSYPSVKTAVDADTEWLRLQAAQNLDSSKEWHFFPNSKGEVGPDPQLAAKLQEGGIKIVVHTGPDWQKVAAQGGGAAAGAGAGADSSANADAQRPVAPRSRH